MIFAHLGAGDAEAIRLAKRAENAEREMRLFALLVKYAYLFREWDLLEARHTG